MHGYQTFHENIMNNLLESIEQGACSHAYIFEGAKGLYKLENARLFAAALTCRSSGHVPCGVCQSCIESAADSNPDIIYVEKPKDKTRIPVDVIRKVNEDAIIKPFDSPRKVYIIKDGDLLTPEAQNAFLKTFEEPPEYAVFIIIAESASSLLPTILSRAVLITFPPVPNKKIEQWLMESYPDEQKKIPFLVSFCEGIPGTAEDILKNPEFDSLRQDALQALGLLLSHEKSDAFKIEEFIDSHKEYASSIFDFWISYLRDILVLQCSAFDKAVNIDRLSELKKYSERFSEQSVIRAIELLLEGKRMLDRYVKAGAVVLRCALRIDQKVRQSSAKI